MRRACAVLLFLSFVACAAPAPRPDPAQREAEVRANQAAQRAAHERTQREQEREKQERAARRKAYVDAHRDEMSPEVAQALIDGTPWFGMTVDQVLAVIDNEERLVRHRTRHATATGLSEHWIIGAPRGDSSTVSLIFHNGKVTSIHLDESH